MNQRNADLLIKEKDTAHLECYYCTSCQIIKYGFQESRFNPQRYKCKICGKTFNKNTGGLIGYCKISSEKVHRMLRLYIRGCPVPIISEQVNITQNTVRKIVKESVSYFVKFDTFLRIQSNYCPKVLEIDEIYVYIQGLRRFYAWIAFDPVNRFVLGFKPGGRNKETLVRLFEEIYIYLKEIDLVLVDNYQGYRRCILDFLVKKWAPPITGVVHKSDKNRGYRTYEMFGRSKKTVEKKVKKYGLGKKINASHIEALNTAIRDFTNGMRRRSRRKARSLKWIGTAPNGFMFYHNYIRPHNALNKKTSDNWIKTPVTPAMAAEITNRPLQIRDALRWRMPK